MASLSLLSSPVHPVTPLPDQEALVMTPGPEGLTAYLPLVRIPARDPALLPADVPILFGVVLRLMQMREGRPGAADVRSQAQEGPTVARQDQGLAHILPCRAGEGEGPQAMNVVVAEVEA